MKPRPRICIFVKTPRAGEVKTRLAPAVGSEAAAALARAFFLDTLAAVKALGWAQPIVAADGDLRDLVEREPGVEVWHQGEGSLGDRLERVLRRALKSGPIAIALGADTPGLPPRFIDEARAALEVADAVIGPCEDGGFYLLGLRSCPRGILKGVPWSAPNTCARALESLKLLGLRTIVLDRWFDVDRPGDLDRLCRLVKRGEIVALETARELHGVSRARVEELSP